MKNDRTNIRLISLALILLSMLIGFDSADAVTPVEYQGIPIIGATSEPPLVMLVRIASRAL